MEQHAEAIDLRSLLSNTRGGTLPGGCFADLTVLESSASVAGAYGAKLLADLGACVIKVEPPDGDPTRRLGPFAGPNSDLGALFLYANSNKFGVTLALGTPTGAGIFEQLVDAADVVITDRDADELKRLGLSEDLAAERRPRLVVASVRPYGLTGPWADHPGTELDVFHASGEGNLLPGGQAHELFADRQPLKAGRFLAQYDAGITVVVAVCAALIRREATGSGDFIEVSEQEAEMSMSRVTHDSVLNRGNVITRRDRKYDYGGLFRCSDGYVNIRPNEDRHWVELARGMGKPHLAEDERFATRTARLRNGAEVNALIADWVRDRSWGDICDQLSAVGTPVGVYADAPAILESPQLQARGAVSELPLDGLSVPFLAAPYQLSETPARIDVRAPHLGEHNRDVFGALGLDQQALADLREAQVI
jgi:crotonobetainyl-CoA:carnitine CoA-transferase CaiB-like acyl-CoA transferase